MGAVLILVSAPAAGHALPFWNLQVAAECTDGGVQINVSVYNYLMDRGSTFIVYRRTVVPGLYGRADLTSEPVTMPAMGSAITLALTDPAMDAESTGFYVTEFRWPDGSLAGTEEVQLSCAGYGFLVRGYLLDHDTILPCQDSGMLECTSVELFYGELTAWVGSSELLDFYGVATNFSAVDDCGIQVYAIEPVGPGADCDSPLPAETVPWSTLKAEYR